MTKISNFVLQTVARLNYRYEQTTWRVNDRYERLVTVAAEVLATPF
jgi:hypothetical protein